MTGEVDRRWEERPLLAAALRLVAFVVPILTSIAAASVASRLLPEPESGLATVVWWVALTAIASVVLLGVDRLARRVLPLVALLQLSLVFPDQAPSRFAVALRSGTIRNLEERVHEVRHGGLGVTPADAAETVIELMGALQVHDRRTRGHAERVRALSDLLGEELHLSKEDRERLRWSALLHDIGKLAVPHHVLNKPGKPDEHEWELLRSHPLEGEKLVGPLTGWLGEWALAIGEHHEKWDGTGYPRALSGHDISRAARIVAVADSYEVMTAARSYKKPQPASAARAELARCSGTHFDPVMVRAFLNIALGKLRIAMGPLSWFAQLPFLNQVPGLAPLATAAGSAAGVILGVFAGGLVDAPSNERPAAIVADRASADRDEVPLGTTTTTTARPAETTTTSEAARSAPTTARSAPSGTPPTTTSAVAVIATPPPPPPIPAPAPVVPGNRPPVARDDGVTTAEDEPVLVDVRANDVDPDGDPLVVRTTTTPTSNATVVVQGDSRVLVTPAPDRTDEIRFGYEVCDPAGLCAAAEVRVRVDPRNDAPLVGGIGLAVAEDTAGTVDLLAVATDPDNDPLTATLTPPPGPTLATATLAGSTLTYTPNPNANGTDSVGFTVCDPTGACTPATVTVTVTPVFDLPVASDDTFTLAEDTTTTLAVLANDTGGDDPLDPATLTIINGTAGATANSDGTIAYTPAANFAGTATVDYRICTTAGNCATANATLTVTPVNDPPQVGGIGLTVAEDTPGTVDLLAVAADLDNDPLTATLTPPPGPTLGAASLSGSTLSYTPNPNANGTDSIGFTVCDPTGTCTPATVTVTITPVFDPPVANNDTATLAEDTATTLAVLANDTGGDDPLDPATLTITNSAAGATANPDGTIAYTPPANFAGTATVDYRICTTAGNCATANATLTVTPVNDPPQVGGIGLTVAEDTPGTVDLLAVAADLDNDPLTATLSPPPGPTLGTATLAGSTVTYTPNPNANGTDTIAFTVCDPAGACTPATVTVTITPVYDPPVANPDTAILAEDTTTTLAVLANDTGGDDPLDPASLTITATTGGSADEQATANPDGTITYAPAANFAGTATVDYRICTTTAGNCATATATITVTPVNDPPTAAADTASTSGTPVTIPVLTNDADVDDGLDPASLRIVTAPSLGTAAVAANGTELVYTPAGPGTATFSYEICDVAGACEIAAVTVYVSTANRAPTAVTDYVSVPHHAVTVLPVAANDVDPDGNLVPTSVSVVSGSTIGGVVQAVGDTIVYDLTDVNYHGPDRLTYAICDADGACAVGVVNIDVHHPENTTPPAAADDAATVYEGTSAVLDVTANDVDPDGSIDPDTVAIVTPPAVGTVEVLRDGLVQYTAPPGATGSTSFVYLVRDDKDVADHATVTITFAAGGSRLYLASADGTADTSSSDSLDLTSAPGPNGPLANYDTDLDADPGRLLQRTSDPFVDTDPENLQRWVSPILGPLTLSGPVSVELWAATKDFDNRRGEIAVQLSDCDLTLTSCTVLAEGLASWQQSATGAAFVPVQAWLGRVDRLLLGRRLVLTLAAPNTSETDVWLGYGIASMPAAVRFLP